jgi:3-(3-hydroxy-phenyl)propionate hydroxylase
MPYIPPKYEAVIPQAVHDGGTEQTTVLIVGAGPIGLALALDLGLRGHDIILVNRESQLTDGSRAICYAKRPLEILDRLGISDRMVEKGVSWNIGRVFFKDRAEPVYSFDLLPVKDQKLPGMINIQQYYNEEYNIEALDGLDNVALRWGNTLTSFEDVDTGVLAGIETSEGVYRIQADWLIACDGYNSVTRKMLGMEFEGETFHDNFLIADVKFRKAYPTERHFWFDPVFNPGQSALLHKQPDDIWRIDFQVGWDIDREEIIKPENVSPRIRAMFGEDVEFEYEWISVYTFNCRQVDQMVKGRVVLAGDAAHLVSPFGARGANTGFQDGDNLAWKLDLIINGKADRRLLESYDQERSLAAKINILNSTRSTDFITPKSIVSRQFRDAVLQLSAEYHFARGFVNSGRLSLPVPYPDSTLNTPDEAAWGGGVRPGTNCMDAPVSTGGEDKWLLNSLGWKFKLLVFADVGDLSEGQLEGLRLLAAADIPVESIFISQFEAGEFSSLNDISGLVQDRYAAGSGAVYLIRPDQYVAGRWHELDLSKLGVALRRATGKQ